MLAGAFHCRIKEPMAIKHPVGPGTILLCDYGKGGFRPPEMVKRRPAIVVSPRLPYRDGLCTVVPISGDPNTHASNYEVQLLFSPALPDPFSYEYGWAKCDMLATVAFERLDLFHTERDQYGRRKYLHLKLPEKDLERVKVGILHALGMGNLTFTGE
jgi:mRNA interferase MazF